MLLYYSILSLWIEQNLMPLGLELPVAPANGSSPGPPNPTLMSPRAATPGGRHSLYWIPSISVLFVAYKIHLSKPTSWPRLLGWAAPGRGGWPRRDLRDTLTRPAHEAEPHPSPPPPAPPPPRLWCAGHARTCSLLQASPPHPVSDFICQVRPLRLGEPMRPPQVLQPKKGGTETPPRALLHGHGRVHALVFSVHPACAHCQAGPRTPGGKRRLFPEHLAGAEPWA